VKRKTKPGLRRKADSCRGACINLWLTLFLLLSTSCHRAETDAERGTRLQVLHKGNGQEVQDLDPQLVNSVSSLNIISALLEGLVSEDPHDLHPVPSVAESWEISSNEKNYILHLRHNAKWSNGEPVIAQNFINSYHRIRLSVSTRIHFLIRPNVKGLYPTILDHHPYKYVRLE